MGNDEKPIEDVSYSNYIPHHKLRIGEKCDVCGHIGDEVERELPIPEKNILTLKVGDIISICNKKHRHFGAKIKIISMAGIDNRNGTLSYEITFPSCGYKIVDKVFIYLSNLEPNTVSYDDIIIIGTSNQEKKE